MRRTRRHSIAVGLLICLPVLLLGALPALVEQLVGERRSVDPTSERTQTARNAGPQVSWGVPVRISGTLRTVLTPGVWVPIKLRFTNPSGTIVILRRVHVRLTGIDAPVADSAHPCTRRDFRIRQMPRRTISLPGRQVADVTELGVPLRAWPRLKLRNRLVNQDGCKGAQLTLDYRAFRDPWS